VATIKSLKISVTVSCTLLPRLVIQTDPPIIVKSKKFILK
jgi:hypothetical protein